MAIAQKKRNDENKSKIGLLTALVAVLALASLLRLLGFGMDCSMAAPSAVLTDQLRKTEPATTTTSSTAAAAAVNPPPSSSSSFSLSFQVSETCLQLPKIRPSGSVFFQNSQIKEASSHPDLVPSFHFGTTFPNPQRVSYHMGGDLPHFQMIAEVLKSSKKTTDNAVMIDVGANQGFFTYYLAALGFEVHAFEIGIQNFEALQHGTLFNPPEISDKVNLYPMGMSSTDGRFGIKGGGYEGFLKASKDGQILSVTMDCFGHHTNIFDRDVAFVKIDVEGFEVEVLKGAKQSLLSSKANKRDIGSLLIEVGPSRWSRSGATLEEGIGVFEELSRQFDSSYVVLRGGDTCPGNKISPSLSSASSKVRELFQVQVWKVAPSDWKPLLESMKANNADCNFWYTNP